MTGAWRGGLQLSHAADIGTNTGASTGFQSPSSTTTAFANGGWGQVVAATPSDSTWMMVYLESINSISTQQAVTIAVGASGSEYTVISNLTCSSCVEHAGIRYLFPMTIAAGTRIAVASSSANTGDSITIGLTLFDDVFSSAGTGSAVDTYGFNPANNCGTAVDPGATANTKGAYTQLSGALTADLSGFNLAFDTQANYSGSQGIINWLVDLAIGGSGSEVVILPNLYLAGHANSNATSAIYAPATGYVPIQIQAGSRVSIRASSSTNNAVDRVIGCTMYGSRL
jgi:hypothetical protein